MSQPDRDRVPAQGRYLVLSPTLVIIGASNAYLAATMIRRQDIVGRPLADVFPGNPAEAEAFGKQNVEASLRRVLASGSSDSLPVQRHDIRRPDGVFEERHWRATSTPILGLDGEVVSIIHHVEDVTSDVYPSQDKLRETTGRAERVEALLADANARLRLTLAAGEIGTWLWDCVHNRVVADANLARMFGVSEEEAQGGPIEAYTRAVHPDDRVRVEQKIAESLSHGTAYETEYRLVSADGSVRWVLARGRVERDADGSVIGLPGMVLDITARVRADQGKLELSERLAQQALIFDTTLSSITDFAYMFDRQGRFAYVNKALLDLWDITLAEAVGKNFFELKYPDELAAKLQSQIQHVFETGEIVRDETPYTSPTGAGGYYEYIFSPVRGSDGAITVVAGSTRDITARKAVEAERERLQEENAQLLQAERAARAEAERLGHAKDEFLATLSHELRTPLNAMLGWAQLIRRRGHDAKTVNEGLTVIERNAQLQRQLIEDLLDMSRIVSGKVRLNVQRIDLGTIVEAALLSARPAADAKQLKVTAVLDRGSAALWGDPNRLQQAIWNLLTNAIKFTPKGGRIEVIQRRNGSTIELSVHDTGQGIDPGFLPYVFERFRQLDASTTRVHGGLGLGLAIVKTLVELHGGRVSAESAGVGHGAIFTICLPQSISNPVARAPSHVEASATPMSELSEFDIQTSILAGLKVLVVDDEADGRQLIGRILEESSAEVALAGSASEALGLLETFRPDVLLGDIGMPDVDGYEMMRQVRARAAGRDIPAAALTALARPEDRTRALRAGYQTHISKPVDAAELVAAVASLARRTGGADPALD